MSDLLREMDHGPSALPAGSSLTLFNNTSTDEVIARVKKRNRCPLTLAHLLLAVASLVVPWWLSDLLPIGQCAPDGPVCSMEGGGGSLSVKRAQ